MYDQAFEFMQETYREYRDARKREGEALERYGRPDHHSGYWRERADRAMYMLFGQAELCKELFGVYALQTIMRIEREFDGK